MVKVHGNGWCCRTFNNVNAGTLDFAITCYGHAATPLRSLPVYQTIISKLIADTVDILPSKVFFHIREIFCL